MTIEPGKHYRCRDGSRARVYCVDGGSDGRMVHGSRLSQSGWWYAPQIWNLNGSYVGAPCSHDHDLIAEWVDAPVVPWDDYPKWCKHVAMDGDGEWSLYIGAPDWNKDGKFWLSGKDDYCAIIPPEYMPQFTGQAKDSLCVRPEGV